MQRPRIELSSEQQRELAAVRDHAAKAYVRERAAALLKLAAGQSLTSVAEHGLLRRYQADGLAGLELDAGRGRKPAFSPSPSGAGAR